jgi:CHAT domain-containing protein
MNNRTVFLRHPKVGLICFFLFKILLIATATGQSVYEKQLEDARIHIQNRNYSAAITTAQEIADRAAQSPKQQVIYAEALTVLGNAYRHKGQTSKAIFFLKKAYILRSHIFNNKALPVANAAQNLAHAYMDAEQFSLALPLLLKTRRIREFDNHIPQNSLDVAKSYASLSNLWNLMSKPDSTIQLLTPVVEQAPPQYKAGFYVNLGNAYAQKENWLTAQKAYQQARQLAIQDSKIHTHCCIGLGNTFIELGNPVEAQRYFRQAMSIWDTSRVEPTIDYADILTSFALAERRLDEHNAAIRHLETAFNIYKNNKKTVQQTNTALNLGIYLTENRAYTEALYYFNEAEKRSTTAQLANIRLQKGILFLEQKKYTEADILFINALQAAEFAPHKSTLTTEIYLNRGLCAAAKKQFVIAQSHFQRAQLFMQRAGEQADYLLFLRLIATEAHTAKKSDSSFLNAKSYLSRYDTIINLLEKVMARTDAQASVWFWQKQFSFLFDDAIELCFVLGQRDPTYIEKAFTYTEKAKNVWLLRRQKMQLFFQQNRSDSLIRREADIQLRLALLEKDRSMWTSQAKNTLLSKRITTIDAQIFELKSELNTLHNVFQKLGFNVENTPFYLYKIQNTLTDNQVIMQYHVTTDHIIWLFLVKKGGFDLKRLEKQADLSAKISRFYTAMSTPPDGRQGMLEVTRFATDLRVLSFDFYQQLIAPAQIFLKDKTDVTILADAELSILPFEALCTEGVGSDVGIWNYPFLVKQYTIHYAYNLAALVEKNVEEPSANVLLMAPEFDKNQSIWQPLVYNKREIDLIYGQIGGKRLVGTEAKEETFLTAQQQQHFSVVHLATHGLADFENPDLSGVAFTEVTDSIENEMLFVREIEGQQFNIDLLVLSACQTNIGQFRIGEGVMSLARAFAGSGVRSIITSMWSINDQATAELMVQFYKNLKSDMRPSVALQAAKLALMDKSNTLAHPFYWAAMVHIGNDTPVRLPFNYKWIPLSICSILGALVIFFFWKKRK